MLDAGFADFWTFSLRIASYCLNASDLVLIANRNEKNVKKFINIIKNEYKIYSSPSFYKFEYLILIC